MITSRKSIVASRDLPIGHIIEYSDLAFKRPGDGLSPMIYPRLIGKKVISKIKADQKISLENLS
jgi:sialic acid synthase SpsE